MGLTKDYSLAIVTGSLIFWWFLNLLVVPEIGYFVSGNWAENVETEKKWRRVYSASKKKRKPEFDSQYLKIDKRCNNTDFSGW